MRRFLGTARGAGAVLAVVVVGFVNTSCGSNATGPSLSGNLDLQFKANGTTVDFTTQGSLVAAFADTAGQYDALITGYDATSGLGLVIFDGSPITTATYPAFTLNAGSGKAFGVQISYYDSHGSYGSGNQNPDNATVTITSLTSTRVQGTFSGTVSAASGGAAIAITDGKFVVQRVN